MSFSHQCQVVGFYRSLSDHKSPRVSRTLLSILANLLMLSEWSQFFLRFSTFPIPFLNLLETIPSAPTTIDITVTCGIDSYFCSLARYIFFYFYSVSAGIEKSKIFFFLLLISLLFWSELGNPFVSHKLCGFYVSQFLRQILALGTYHLVGNSNRGRPEGFLFNRYYTKVSGRALHLSLDCSTLPLIRTLYCWALSKEVSSTIFRVFGMTRLGIEPRSPTKKISFSSMVKIHYFVEFLVGHLSHSAVPRLVLLLCKIATFTWLIISSPHNFHLLFCCL